MSLKQALLKAERRERERPLNEKFQSKKILTTFDPTIQRSPFLKFKMFCNSSGGMSYLTLCIDFWDIFTIFLQFVSAIHFFE